MLSRFAISIFLSLFAIQAQGFSFGEPQVSQEESSQIIKILETFSNGCSLTRGPSADAIAVVKGLSSAVKSALSSPNCQSLAGSVSSLDSTVMQALSLAPQIHDSYLNELDQKVNALQKQKEEIATLLTQTSDASEIAQLRQELYRVRIELAGTLSEAKDSALNDHKLRQTQSVKLLLGATNQAVNQILANEACWVGQPSLLQQVAGVGSTLGASTVLTTSASQKAVLLTAGLSILSTIVDFFERFSQAKKLAQLDLALGSTALTCALEKMNDVFCSAQDTLNAIEKVGAQFHKPHSDPVWQGVGLLEKEIPVLLSWLQKIKSGGGASTIEDSAKQAHMEVQEVNLTNSKRIFEAYVKDTQIRFDQATTAESKFSFLRNMVANFYFSICANHGQGPPPNPLCKSHYGDSYVLFYLLGLSAKNYQDLLKINSTLDFFSVTYDLIASLDGLDPSLLTLNRSREQFTKWYSEVEEQFLIEKKLVLGQDLALVFDEALKRNYSVSNPVTAQTAIESLVQFLKAQDEKNFIEDAQLDLRNEALQILEEVLHQIILVAKKQTTPAEAKNVIFQIADLKTGTSYLGDRLERLVSSQLEKLVYDSDKLEEETRLPLLAAQDVIAELRRYYQTSSLQELQESATNAQLIMVKTIDPFIRLFTTPLIRAFNEFDSAQNQVGSKTLKTKLCFYMLNSTRSRDFFVKECEGLMGESVLGITTPKFSKEMFKGRLQDRACLYRTFIMKNRVMEKQRVKSSSKFQSLVPLFEN